MNHGRNVTIKKKTLISYPILLMSTHVQLELTYHITVHSSKNETLILVTKFCIVQ